MVLAFLWAIAAFLMLVLVAGALVWREHDGPVAVLFLAFLLSGLVAILGWMHGQGISWDSQGFVLWRLFRRTTVRWSDVLAVRQWSEQAPRYWFRHDHVMVWARGLSGPIRFNPSWFRKADGARFMARLLEAERASTGTRPAVKHLHWGTWVFWLLAAVLLALVVVGYRAWTHRPTLWFRVGGLAAVWSLLAYRVHRGDVRFDGQALHHRRFRWHSTPLREIHEARLEGTSPPWLRAYSENNGSPV